MGWALVEISPDRVVGVCWVNQFIGNLWGVRSGRLIPGDQLLSVLPALDRSDSMISTYRDDGELRIGAFSPGTAPGINTAPQ
jgi:hypothetical protein